MAKYNMIATSLSKPKAERVIELNPMLLRGYRFVKHSDIDFSWWDRCRKYLTASNLHTATSFEVDLHGNVTKYVAY